MSLKEVHFSFSLFYVNIMPAPDTCYPDTVTCQVTDWSWLFFFFFREKSVMLYSSEKILKKKKKIFFCHIH